MGKSRTGEGPGRTPETMSFAVNNKMIQQSKNYFANSIVYYVTWSGGYRYSIGSER